MKKRITGIVLAALGALMLLVHVINGTFSELSAEDNSMTLLAAYIIILIVGIVLITPGKGKDKENNK